MPKVSLTITIPDGWELDDPEMRPPLSGEHYLDSCGHVQQATHNWNHRCRPILRRCAVWSDWPEWITAEWVAMDADGEWCLYKDEPEANEIDDWWTSDGEFVLANRQLLEIAFPTCNDWRQSKFRNPRSTNAQSR